MKKIVLLILVIAVTGLLFANDFQGKVYEFKKGPKSYKGCEFQFFDDALLICNANEGTYTQYQYTVSGGTIHFEDVQSPNQIDCIAERSLPFTLKDGTAILELQLNDGVLVLYDSGRRQYRSDLAFGILDKATVATSLIGIASVNQRYGKFYETDRYVRNNGGMAPDGYRGGSQFKNYEGRLPVTGRDGSAIMYREYDVNPYVRGVNRGAERLVMSSNGGSYITIDHYQSFIQMY